MKMMSKVFAAVTASALLAGSAQAACWTEAAYQAAQVRELDTMLMVQALRCRKATSSIVGSYNRFIQVSRPTLIKANAELKGHFAAEVGERGAMNAYDNYMTTVANRYGAGVEDMDCGDVASMVRAASDVGSSAAGLQQIAEQADLKPRVDGRRCPRGAGSPLSIASRR